MEWSAAVEAVAGYVPNRERLFIADYPLSAKVGGGEGGGPVHATNPKNHKLESPMSWVNQP